METKEIKVIAPEGYEIDRENSTLERIVFKKKSGGRPKSWEEYANSINGVGMHFISSCTDNIVKQETPISKSELKKNLCFSKKEAEAFLALMQLRQLRKSWIGDWEPDYSTDDIKWYLYYQFNNIKFEYSEDTSRPLSFPTYEMAYEFFKSFQDLIEQAKILL